MISLFHHRKRICLPGRVHTGARYGWLCGVATAACLFVSFFAAESAGQVHYDRGRRTIAGVQLLQSYHDSLAYYYLPQTPRLSRNEDGSFQLLCLKYVGSEGETNGGLLHALFEFSLPVELVAQVAAELKEEIPGARLAGPVPLLQATEDGEEGIGGFQIVSAVLSDQGEGGLTRSLISSGRAPLLPGSKAAVAAMLEPEGATLLWDSFTGATSDVSVSVHGYYEAAVPAFEAVVTADITQLYDHFSDLSNEQAGFTRDQVLTATDSLVRDGVIDVQTLDRTGAFDLDATQMEDLLSVMVDRLTEVMFDATTGWTSNPPRETAGSGEIPGRPDEGFLTKVFGAGVLQTLGFDTTGNAYYTDYQYVLKNRRDIRRSKFSINLTKNATVRIPVDAAGNLGGVFDRFGDDKRYFRIVNLDDPAFEYHNVQFVVDGAYLDAFDTLMNFVAVNVRKRYPNSPDFTRSFEISKPDVERGVTTAEVAFPRLGDQSALWKTFEYQVVWSLQGGGEVRFPSSGREWARSEDAAVSLRPPLEKTVIEVDADQASIMSQGLASGVVQFAKVLLGEPKRQPDVILRPDDPESTRRVVVYHDPGAPIAYRVNWHGTSGSTRGKLNELHEDYLLVTPNGAGQ